MFKPVSDSCLRASLDRSINSVKKLSSRYKELIYLRFGLNDDTPKTFREIASARHCSGSNIGMIVNNAIKRLRHSSKMAHLRDFLAEAP